MLFIAKSILGTSTTYLPNGSLVLDYLRSSIVSVVLPQNFALSPVIIFICEEEPRRQDTMNLLALDELVSLFARAHHSGCIFADSSCILYRCMHLLEQEMFGYRIDQDYMWPMTPQTKRGKTYT